MEAKLIILVFTCLLFKIIQCLPYDDGKYRPGKYSKEDGKYYRPRYEGKYIPTDEGKYTYIYRQGLYPSDNGDYRYIHIAGPNGPGDAPVGSDRFDPLTSDPFFNDYIGYQVYADKYPYIHNEIEALIDKFVSKNYALYGDGSEMNNYLYNKMKPSETDSVSAMKCQIIEQNDSDTKPKKSEAFKESSSETTKSEPDTTTVREPETTTDLQPETTTVFESEITVSPEPEKVEPESTTKSKHKDFDLFVDSLPSIYPKDGEDLGQFYNFKGLKTIIVASDDKLTKKKKKLQYEITVRVLDEI